MVRGFRRIMELAAGKNVRRMMSSQEIPQALPKFFAAALVNLCTRRKILFNFYSFGLTTTL
jgi:hypothetical protein